LFTNFPSPVHPHPKIKQAPKDDTGVKFLNFKFEKTMFIMVELCPFADSQIKCP